MIVVVGRPALVRTGVAGPELGGNAAGICLAIAAGGQRCELVGSIGDDPEGDEVAVLLGRAGVGHAALLRDPAGRTPVGGEDRQPRSRLDAGDVDLGLRYLADVQVLILAEPLAEAAQRAALEAAAYHGAPVVAILTAGDSGAPGLPEDATVLTAPEDDSPAFHELVARYAVALAARVEPEQAFRDAAAGTRWESLAE